MRIDVDALLAELGPEFDEMPDDEWGGANLCFDFEDGTE